MLDPDTLDWAGLTDKYGLVDYEIEELRTLFSSSPDPVLYMDSLWQTGILEVPLAVVTQPEITTKLRIELLDFLIYQACGPNRLVPDGLQPGPDGTLPVCPTISDRVGELTALLADPDSGVRCRVAALLGWVPDQVQTIAPVLRARLDSDPDVVVRATAGVTLAMVSGDETAVPVFLDWLAGDEPLLRWAGAVALGKLLGSRAPSEVVDVLADWAALRASAAEADRIPFPDNDLGSVAANTLPLCGPGAGRAAGDLIRTLPALDREPAERYGSPIIELAFPEPLAPDTPFSALDTVQKAAVRAIAATRVRFDTNPLAFTGPLSACGIPVHTSIYDEGDDPLYQWIGLAFHSYRLREQDQPDGTIIIAGFAEQAAQINEVYDRMAASFTHAEWNEQLDRERYFRFLGRAFDITVHECETAFPGRVRIQWRSEIQLFVDVSPAGLS